jgi:purine-binding chemotaxis protein CheW
VAPGSDEARAAAAEAARLEAELAAKLADLPTAPDARFRTWRPAMDQASDLAPIAPEPETEPRLGRRPSERGTERRAEESPAPSVGDPLEEFFYRVDEPGPELGVLAGSAPVAPAAPVPVERVEYLTFLLGTEEYGVEIDRIREVMRSPPITEVPRAPPDVLGVITVRGEVVAVYDPRRRLGLRCDPGTGGGRVLIVDDGAGPCGLLVDAVASVVRLPRGTIEPCPQGIGGAAADCLEGIGRERDRLFTVLSIPALLRPVRRVGEGKG